MVFYDNKILNPNLAPKWFTNVTVIEITTNPGVSGTDPFYGFLQTKYALLHGQTSERERQIDFHRSFIPCKLQIIWHGDYLSPPKSYCTAK